MSASSAMMLHHTHSDNFFALGGAGGIDYSVFLGDDSNAYLTEEHSDTGVTLKIIVSSI